MAEELVRLAAEMDITGARGPVTAAQESERAWSKSTGAMDASTRKVERSMLDLGQTTRKIAGLATSAFTAVSAGITASKANADNLESSMVSIGAALTASFLAGGPIGLGIGALAVGIGFVAGRTSDAEKAALRAKAAHESWLKGTRAEAAAATKSVEGLRSEIEDTLRSIAGKDLRVDSAVKGSRLDNAIEDFGALSRRLDNLKDLGATRTDIDQAQAKVNATLALIAELEKAQQETFVRSALGRILGSVEEGRRLQELPGEVARLDRAIAGLEIPRDLWRFLQVPKDVLASIEDARESLHLARQLAAANDQIGREAPAIEHAEKLEGIRARLTNQSADELALQQEIARIQAQINVYEKIGGDLGRDQARALSIVKQRREEELDVLVTVNGELRTRSQLAGDNALRNEIELLGARNAREREVVRIYQAQRQALEAGRDPALVAERVRLQLAALDAQTVVDPFLQGLTTTLGGGLTEIVMDGITTGFERSSDIALDIVNSLLRQILASIVQSGIAELMGSVLGGAGGGGGGIGGIISTVVGAVGGGGTSTFSGGGAVSTVVSAVGGGAPAAPC